MRFLSGGPSIPDELLLARDEGRVVFFCGAGVSRARAGLPEFFGLARKATELLGVAPDGPPKKLIDEAREIATRVGESGLISADRVFGLLDREFAAHDIHAAVAKSLTPALDVDLSAHRVMLDLARGPDGKVRLVTTNFDRLFEACDSSLPYSRPPRLPDLRRREDLHGIVHLHGRVNEKYDGAEGDGLVLSSSEFGRAYLSEAWATEFIRSVLEKYLVLFVGYTADDPPVHYLLEALNLSSGSRMPMYAFQSGDQSEAQSKWLHKGVHAISYDPIDNHRVLWDTLQAWSIRARDVEEWYKSTIELARKGPEALLPHERGQVAHVVSTLEGVRRFSTSDPPPPANWLCVFDSRVRYSTPRNEFNRGQGGPFVDPFVLYGLDGDVAPESINPDNPYAKRVTPRDAWNCFNWSRLDRQDVTDQNLPAFIGYLSTHLPSLPARLRQLGFWISKVACQPAAVWWAAGQNGMHPDIQKQIHFALSRNVNFAHPEIRKAWRYIFEAWSASERRDYHDWFDLQAAVAQDGWTSSAMRALGSMYGPRMEVSRPLGSPKPPEDRDDLTYQDVASLDVKYADLHETVTLPDEYLLKAVREIRGNLELAVVLENELGGYGLGSLAPIEPDPDLAGESTTRSFGISALLLFYVRLFDQLVKKDRIAARRECLAWWTDDETIFARLRIWACGNPLVLSGPEAADVIAKLNGRVFWSSGHQRDLLLVLARRWQDFPPALQETLEERILKGPKRWDDEEESHYVERRAWLTLNRIYWLHANGCRITFDINEKTAELRKLAPRWQPEDASKATASMEGRSGWVKTEKDFEPLLAVPLSKVIEKAVELSGHDHERFIRRDPFAGLALGRLVRALSALTRSAKRGEYPEWAWRTFLNPEARKSDRPKFSALIGERVARIPPSALGEITYAISEWLLKASEMLLKEYPSQFERVWKAVLAQLRASSEHGKSSVIRGNREPEWATEALNAAVGKLAQAVMNDPQKEHLKAGQGFPPGWLRRVDELLSLEGDSRRHALVMFAFNLTWFYTIDPVWTEKQLLSVIELDGEDKDAVWAGFLWGAGAVGVPPLSLCLRLKSRLLELAKSGSLSRRGHIDALTAILLVGWARPSVGYGLVTDAEARDVLANAEENFRLHILWQLGRWAKDNKHWLDQVARFLADAWPRQKKAKSPKITARLCELAFSNPTIFPEIADIILSLVTKADGEHLLLHDLSIKGGVIEQHPEKTLALLHAVLPDETSTWPHRIDEVLERISVADPALGKDPRLVELKRRWNAW